MPMPPAAFCPARRPDWAGVRSSGRPMDDLAEHPAFILNDPRRLGLPGDVVPWMLVANNTYAHSRQHEPAIQTWLDRTKQERVQ